MRRGQSADLVWLALAAAIYVSVTAGTISTRHYWPRYDSGAYISAATAVARGLGLRDITAPVTRPAESWAHIQPWVRSSPEQMARPDWPLFVQYPPLLPLLLAPLVALGDGRYVVLQTVPLLAGLGTLVLVYRWRETLFPGPWRLTLVLCAGSTLALYATRVQSESLHALVVIVSLRVLARAGEEERALLRWTPLAGLVLLVALAVHLKVVFFAAGAVVWILVAARAPLLRRVLVAGTLGAATLLPPLAFMFLASWSGRAGLPAGGPAFTLADNPYLSIKGVWEPSNLLAGTMALQTLARRLGAAGTLAWNGIVVGPYAVAATPLSVGLLLVVALLAGPWWRHRRGLLAIPTATYLVGVLASPWTSTRMVVPVLPIVSYALSLSVARLASLLGRHDRRAERLFAGSAGVLLFCAQLSSWSRHGPMSDEYAVEFGANVRSLALARAAAEVPPERPIIADIDNSAFALATGRATQPVAAYEWKLSNPEALLLCGGAPVTLRLASGRDGRLAEIAAPHVRRITTLGSEGVVAGWVRVPPPAPNTVTPDPFVPGRIHRRWMRLTPADREPLAHAAVAEPVCAGPF